VSAQVVTYEQRDGIAYITLNRPEVLNALNDELLKQLRDAMFQLDGDPDAMVGIMRTAIPVSSSRKPQLNSHLSQQFRFVRGVRLQADLPRSG